MLLLRQRSSTGRTSEETAHKSSLRRSFRDLVGTVVAVALVTAGFFVIQRRLCSRLAVAAAVAPPLRCGGGGEGGGSGALDAEECQKEEIAERKQAFWGNKIYIEHASDNNTTSYLMCVSSCYICFFLLHVLLLRAPRRFLRKQQFSLKRKKAFCCHCHQYSCQSRADRDVADTAAAARVTEVPLLQQILRQLLPRCSQ